MAKQEKQEKQLDELFHETLKDIYYAEKKLVSTLPKMAKAAHSDELKAAFEKHLAETEGQVERLEQVFAMIDETPKGKTCDAINGLVDEGKEIMSTSRVHRRTTRGSWQRRRRSSTTRSPATARCEPGRSSSA